MDNKFFSLENIESNRLIRMFQIIFGIICIITAAFWLVFNIKSVKTDGTLWITIVFLACFGIFLIWAGLDFASKFIELDSDKIRLKINSILPLKEIHADQIEKIELFPLNLIFIIKPGKRIVLRFGVTYPDRIDLIKDEVIKFAQLNQILLEIKEEFI